MNFEIKLNNSVKEFYSPLEDIYIVLRRILMMFSLCSAIIQVATFADMHFHVKYTYAWEELLNQMQLMKGKSSKIIYIVTFVSMDVKIKYFE